MSLPLADPMVAAAVFEDHLNRAMETSFAARSGWSFDRTGPLEAIVHLTALRKDETRDPYHLRLRADWYDALPPQAMFVTPPLPGTAIWREPEVGSRWMPHINQSTIPDGRFAFHPRYPIEGLQTQLICCSMSLDYYRTGHAPTPAQRWRQGRHTLVALLTRVQEVLVPPTYEGPAGDLDT